MTYVEYWIFYNCWKYQNPKLWQSWHHNQFLHQHGVPKMHHWHKNVPITQMSPTILKFKEMKWMLLVFMNNRRETRFFPSYYEHISSVSSKEMGNSWSLIQLSVKWKNEKSKSKYKCKLQDIHRTYYMYISIQTCNKA